MTNKFKYYDDFLLTECTMVSGIVDKQRFLFKNRDRSFKPEHTVVKEKMNNIEVAYYTDQTGWFEGMNEFGVAFVSSLLTKKDWTSYSPSYYVTKNPKPISQRRTKYKRYNKIYEVFKKLLLSKTAEDGLKILQKSSEILRNNSILISDSKETYEIELYKKDIKFQKIDLSTNNVYVKSNHGELFDDAGHKDGTIKKSISKISQHQAEIQLQGIEKITEIPGRMKFQAYDSSSPLNVFRTDDEEHTTSQCLMNLTKLEFTFYHDDRTAKSLVFDNKLEDSKINVQIIRYGA